jgi:U3 small nucleolar RNA-associated protein 14
MKRGKEKARRDNEATADAILSEVSKITSGNNKNQQQKESQQHQQTTTSGVRMKFNTPNNVEADLKQQQTNNKKKQKESGARRQRDDNDDQDQEQQQQHQQEDIDFENNTNNNDEEQLLRQLEESSSSRKKTVSNTKATTSTSSSSAKTKINNSSSSSSATTSIKIKQSEEEKKDRQDYLISRAFAQDELDEEFDHKKEAQVNSIMKPEDPNASLPGWGEWGGNDAKLNQRHKDKVAAADLKRRMERSTLLGARADAHLDNVIINHDVDLVPGKYQLHMVPRPFASATEFHRSMRQPVGPEWTTPQSFKRQIAPKVMAKSGVVIDPVDNNTGLRKKSKTSMKKKDVGIGKKKLVVNKK